MKKYVSLLLAVLLLLCGCSKTPNAEETTAAPVSTQAATKAPTETTAPPEVLTVPDMSQPEALQSTAELPSGLEGWVSTCYQESFIWKDTMGNLCSVSVSLPALAPVTDFAVEFNQTVYAYGTRILDEVRPCVQERYWSDLHSVSYEAYLNGDILSILIIERTNVDLVYYDAYSFDLGDMEPLTTAELCEEVLDMSYPAFLIAGNQIIEKEFTSKYSAFVEPESEIPTAEEEAELALYESILQGIPTLNASARDLYLGEDGQVMFIYWAPSMAGASYYPQAVEFDLRQVSWDRVPTEKEAYGWLFGLRYDVDGAYAESYCAILAKAFLEDSGEFVEQAAGLTSTAIADIAGFTVYGLDPDQSETFEDVCNALYAGDPSPEEMKVIQALVTAFTE